MRISDLAREAGLPVATVKYYLREHLLPPGRPTARTQAEYDGTHLARLRLVRALVHVGGLSLAQVHAVLEALDADPEQLPWAVGRAHEALSGHPAPPADAPAGPALDPAGLEALRALGWHVDPRSATVRRFCEAVAGARELGLPLDDSRLAVYARAALDVAHHDVATVPRDGGAMVGPAAVEHVVLGTVLYEPVLLALRRLAQQHVFIDAQGPADAG